MPNLSTYTQVGRVEDVSDIITNIAPTKTPFQSAIGDESIHDITHSWQEDDLDAPGTNAQVEGAAAPAANFSPTVMRSNNTQILAKTASATGSTEARKVHGRAKELAYQLGKKSAEIKRDLEKALLAGATHAAVLGSATVPRTMAAAQTMIDASVTIAPETASALTEANILAANQALYNVGGEADTISLKPGDATVFAGFAAAAGRTRYVDGGAKKIVNVVNVYESPYGQQKVVLNRWQPTTDAILYDASMWKRLVYRNWFRKTLAVVGDSESVEIIGEFSLKHKNFKGSALITNLT